MSLFALMTQLPKRDRERIARCVRDFAQAWEYCTIEQLPQLTELHLPRNAPALRTLVLQEFILVDLKNRWTKGEPAVLEYYLEVFQELGGADGICTQLIYEEYRIRSNYDRGIALREYQRRFPHHYSELLRVAAETIDPASTEAGTLTPSAPLEMVMVGGGFRLIRLLGRGTYGEVWLAEAPGGVQVALKLSRALGYQVTRGELRSLEAIKRLRHPFLIQLQAYWQRDDQIIIAMELGGINLEERLRECQQEGHPGIPAAELVGYVRDCAEALDYLHREGTVHRDIKPANILIQNDHAKVGDFGLARFFDKEQSDTRSTVMGTPTYMPPELWKGRVAPQSDQYCLACTYVELRTGHPAMRGKSQAELCEEHQRGSPDLRELTDAEMQVVLKALAKQLGDRYPTCGDFARALQYAVEPAAPRRDASADVRRARWTAILALVTSGALVATAIGGAFWYTTRRLEMPVARERAAQLESPAPPRTVEAPDLWVQAMVELSAGSTAPLDLDFQRFQTPATLHIEGVPQGVTLSGIPDGPLRNDGRLALAVVASEVVDTQQCTLEVFVRWGDAQQMTKSVDLRVRGFDLRMPPGYEPASGAERRAVPWEGRKYWTRIQHQMFPDCTLLLIPQERRPDPTDPADPPTYYILENKVSNQLWTAVVSAYPETSTSESWRQSDVWQRGVSNAGGPLVVADHPHLPVFHISANDAAEFARLLGGELPSFFQWDKAAGRFHPERGAGPFQGGWQPGDPAAIAVGREQLGPAAVGASSQDRSLYGCLDMSGNGEELTGKTYKNRPLPLGQPFLSDPEFNGVYVRGRSYTEETPLLFSDLDALDKEEREKGFCTAPSLGCDETRPFISFRIVVGSADKWVIAQSATAGPP